MNSDDLKYEIENLEGTELLTESDMNIIKESIKELIKSKLAN